MSRPTADIVADLLDGVSDLGYEAADRLAELNAKVEAMEPRIQSAVQKVCDRFNMFRPPCPTCGGDGLGRDALGYVYQRPDPCPDCVDGKVSLERCMEWVDYIITQAANGNEFAKTCLTIR